MGCATSSATAGGQAEYADASRRSRGSDMAEVLVHQAEGHPSVRVYERPDTGSRKVDEIPSGEHATKLQEADGFVKVQWKQLQGWVGKKNVRPLASNAPPAVVWRPNVFLQQAEGHSTVRVYAKPVTGGKVVEEIPSGEHALKVDQAEGFAKVQWRGKGKQLEGWVGKKNVRPLDSNALPAVLPRPGAQPVAGNTGSEPTAELPPALQALALLHLMLGGGGDAFDAPMNAFDPSKGLHFHSDLRTVTVEAGKKRARCTEAGKRTIFSEEILQPNEPSDFRVKVVAAQGSIIIVGSVPRVPNGYSQYALGEKEFEGTIGALFHGEPGVILHEDAIVGLTPSMQDGDIIGFRVRQGTVYLTHNDVTFGGYQVNGEFRAGLTMTADGQVAEILSAENMAGKLKEGCKVTLPLESARVKNMRSRFVPLMQDHCGQIGDVVEMKSRQVKVMVNGVALLWDIELFGPEHQRFCRLGCDLKDHNLDSPCICNVCLARLPVGYSLRRCEKHDFDICPYCCGKAYAPKVGVKVIPGSSYTWGNHEGAPYQEGEVLSEPDEQGHFKVKWGEKDQVRVHRGPPYQDVIEAKQNGLSGMKPPKEESGGALDLVGRPDPSMGSQGRRTSQSLPKNSKKQDESWRVFSGHESITVDRDGKVAICRKDCMSSVLTEQVFDVDGPVEFKVKVCSSKETHIIVGIVGDDAKGFESRTLGSEALIGSIGAVMLPSGGGVVHAGEIVGTTPGLTDGDIVSIRVEGGKCQWALNGETFHKFRATARLMRFGFCMRAQGQSVEVMEDQRAPLTPALQLQMGTGIPEITWTSQPDSLLKVDLSDPSQKLGAGGFGETWKGTIKTKDNQVAVKILAKNKIAPEMVSDFAKEVKAFASLTLPGGEAHQHLLKLIAIVPDRFAMVTELCKCDLAAYMKENPRLSVQKRVTLMLHVAVGMAWLVEKAFVHRDLKMENVLITEGGTAKIADFGLARLQEDTTGEIAGTLMYIAPEVFAGHCSEKSDVYSFAYIQLATFSGKEVEFTDFLKRIGLLDMLNLKSKFIEAVKRGDRPKIPEIVPHWAATSIEKCWDKEFLKRPKFVNLAEQLRLKSLEEM